MMWLAENWYYIVFVILCLGVMAYGLACGRAKEWLKWAVCYAEEVLGSGTGQLKLRYVYDMFIEQFPTLSSIISFTVFSKWVDLALEWMREQLEKNENIKALIEGTE